MCDTVTVTPSRPKCDSVTSSPLGDVTVTTSQKLVAGVPSGNVKRRKRQPKAICKHGHAMTPENTRIRPNGNRECRECLNAFKRAYRKTEAGKATTKRNLIAWAKRQEAK